MPNVRIFFVDYLKENCSKKKKKTTKLVGFYVVQCIAKGAESACPVNEKQVLTVDRRILRLRHGRLRKAWNNFEKTHDATTRHFV